jgi:Domain of unknown function (DUF4296)
MKYFLIILSFFFFLLIACKEETKMKPPSDVISRGKFVELLTKVRLLEGAYSTRYARVDSSDYKIEAHYLTLFNQAGVTREQFLNSYSFYAADQPGMLEIEADIVKELDKLQPQRDSLSMAIDTQPDTTIKKVFIDMRK